jgi:transposase
LSAADQIEFVDITPEQLHSRIARTDVMDTDAAQVALEGFFSAQHLATLRSLALGWLDGHHRLDPGLRITLENAGRPSDEHERVVLRLLGKRNHEIGRLQNIVVSCLHAALANLSPGGISKERNASDAVRLLGNFNPISPVEQTRYDLALELLDDVKRLDVQLKESHKRIKTAVKASGTSLTELYGVGPILACELIGYTGDVRRFTTRDQFASYAGVAPIELSSGGRIVHRLSRRGNRQLNHAIHMVAICQIRQKNSEGRIYFERKVTIPPLAGYLE